jgi:hypothetical protein
MTGQILLPIRSEIAVFAFVFLDSPGVMSAFVDMQIVFVSEFLSARWTGIGSLIDRQVCGKVDSEGSFTDGGLGAKITHVGVGSVV